MNLLFIFFCLVAHLQLCGFGTQELFAKYPNRYFIESGSYAGDGIQMALNAGFSTIFSIELSPHYYKRCCHRFNSYPNVKLYQGDSGHILSTVLQQIDAPATFWLDGHYSSGDTAKGMTNSPILAELEAIGAHPIKTHTLLIDDIRQCGSVEFDFVELDMIVQKILKINPNYTISFEDGFVPKDVLVAQVPKREIRVVCTSALIDYNYEMRKQEYIRSFQLFQSYGYAPYVFEACHPASPSFLEQYAADVFYSNVNDARLINKGVNEARSLMEGFKHYQFNAADMIIKMTGRYHLESRDFLKIVEENPDADMFVRCDEAYPTPFGKVFTGCFALRYKLFKEMLESIDFEKMERELIDFEVEVANFAQKLVARGTKVVYLKNLQVSANIGSPFPPQLSFW